MENQSNDKKYLLISGLIVVVVGSFLGGYFFSRAGYAIETAPLRFTHLNRDQAPQDVNWQILWDTLQAIDKKFVDGPVDQQELLYGAVSGAVASLGDPYSVFMTPQKSQQFQEDLRGEFSGIGAEIGIRQERLMIVSPLDGSPAEKAGLRPLDVILAVDGESAINFSLDEAVGKIRGEKGSTVVLTVLSDGAEEAKDVAIVRDTIVVKSVELDISEKDGNKIAVIKLRRFGEDTKKDLDKAVTDLLKENVKGIILDVRNNPGGFITSAIDVASNWVKDGEVVVSEQFGDGRKDGHRASGVPRLSGIPTVVLINEGSASASEIVAGALRDHELATLIGKKSFGKGSVQELIDLPEGADLKITIAKWLTPDGFNINVEGIEPDIEVDLTSENIDNFEDPQLDRAVEEVLKKM
ncbi:MAG: S41 family peptidase [Candidatus Doudnabacteria bacterium CG10_big_fil_rev_8_21_14_0_10_41_10]|uniref:S41 family peptidase n=1 Tax=Candidatus Doudnabacteria bacterium CG10_big_fil_rev_8_21_14_0_10_41_10 TaxID=1974551 RepID=A0A2H0VEB0_9BACT|nr:MAG: S41 family peptidase [Candidatus Doudnabacteria bacterium CG10_big_fil_rev_8_21_14_0_10_41_10]